MCPTGLTSRAATRTASTAPTPPSRPRASPPPDAPRSRCSSRPSGRAVRRPSGPARAAAIRTCRRLSRHRADQGVAARRTLTAHAGLVVRTRTGVTADRHSRDPARPPARGSARPVPRGCHRRPAMPGAGRAICTSSPHRAPGAARRPTGPEPARPPPQGSRERVPRASPPPDAPRATPVARTAAARGPQGRRWRPAALGPAPVPGVTSVGVRRRGRPLLVRP